MRGSTATTALQNVDAGQNEHLLLSEIFHCRKDSLFACPRVLHAPVRHLIGAVARDITDDDSTDVQNT